MWAGGCRTTWSLKRLTHCCSLTFSFFFFFFPPCRGLAGGEHAEAENGDEVGEACSQCWYMYTYELFTCRPAGNEEQKQAWERKAEKTNRCYLVRSFVSPSFSPRFLLRRDETLLFQSQSYQNCSVTDVVLSDHRRGTFQQMSPSILARRRETELDLVMIS